MLFDETKNIEMVTFKLVRRREKKRCKLQICLSLDKEWKFVLTSEVKLGSSVHSCIFVLHIPSQYNIYYFGHGVDNNNDDDDNDNDHNQNNILKFDDNDMAITMMIVMMMTTTMMITDPSSFPSCRCFPEFCHRYTSSKVEHTVHRTQASLQNGQ